ncbi:hypothetical protein [Lentimicrobium sp. S6]|uniref:hypothetical protein n=1 Tax=Lentimicrobium sp. S6 TaxID=2735872 RepID=UPI0015581DEC|nr:hypothetical protein [Lentimicrobium sp. S6]NPD47532.1 hypothetical protein [Lentimicrobium sp. S6]
MPLILVFIYLFLNFQIDKKEIDSPHGEELSINCEECHNTNSWKIDMTTFKFDHNQRTNFTLEGMHTDVSCAKCHSDLVFQNGKTSCYECHADIHEQTVGFECERCHTNNSWLVENMTEIHQLSRFPLLGAHNTADCYECHTTASSLRFDPLDTECFSCHREDYYATTSPSHVEANYSTDCTQCHQMNAFSWTGTDINHSFFPLTLGHNVSDCASCHTDPNNYGNISSDCFSCHENDYNASTSPNHSGLGFSTDCILCHTTNPGWEPADYTQHDQVFPIYSGEHAGEWNSCIECHPVANNYSVFTCTGCHEHNQSEMDDEHSGISGYVYQDNACLTCHPTGSEDGAFDHNKTGFPLTLGHDVDECASCHTDQNDYGNISTECLACHENDYNSSTSPNHVETGFSTDCILCHTTNPDWEPADYSQHDQIFPIYSGEHASEWNTCLECHPIASDYGVFTCTTCHDHNQSDMDNEHNGINGYVYEDNACLACHPTGSEEGAFDHNNTGFPLTLGHDVNECASCHTDQNDYGNISSECLACHENDYNNSTSPNHVGVGFSTDCILCHTTNPDWEPADYSQHDQIFPIYTGEHASEWNTCLECHPISNDYGIFTCTTCHDHNQSDMDDEHNGINGYVYEDNACLACHPTGSSEGSFNHSETAFPLTGEHIEAECSSCHANGYVGTPTVCFECHNSDFSASINPNHISLNLNTTCEDCHTTEADWEPARFDVHNNYYPLNGAHQSISNECATCHNGDYNSTPNTCYLCHTEEYNQTNDPPHASAQFSTDCMECHTESAWEPSTFNHDAQYFPIYSGKHNDEWNTCTECHTNPASYASFSCIDCHEHSQSEMNGEHDGVSGYVWQSDACFNCHPNGEEDKMHHQIKINR